MTWKVHRPTKPKPRAPPAFAATYRALAVPELVLEILSHVPQPSLPATARLSKFWLSQARQVLYRSPDVATHHALFGAHAGWLLFRTFSGRPELGQIVRGLTISANDDLGRGEPGESKEMIVLRGLLALCPRLDQINFSGKWSDGGEPDGPS